MPKTTDSKSDATEPIKAEPKAAPKTAPAPKLPKPTYVQLKNKLKQVVTISVLDDDGRAHEIRLDPSAISSPLREDRLAPITRNLLTAGRVVVV